MTKPHSVRLDKKTLESLDRHVALNLLIGRRMTRSDVIRAALEHYLLQHDPVLTAHVAKKLNNEYQRSF